MYSLIINKASINRVFLYGVIIRLLICFYFLLIPFHHQKYGIINSFSFQYFADIFFYFKYFNIFNLEGLKWWAVVDLDYILNILKQLDIYYSNYFYEFSYIYKNLLGFNYEIYNSNELEFKHLRFPGPFFPVILYITAYSSEFTIILAILVFMTEILALRLWLNYFNKKIKMIYIIIFASLPVPMFLGAFHSGDVFFYLLSSLIFFIAVQHIKVNKIIFATLLLVFICIRPAAIGILTGLLTYYILQSRRNNYYYIFFTFLCILISLFYYQTYFLVEKTIALKNDVVLDFITTEFPNLGIFELFFYYLTKLFFVFGFHPSSSGNILIYITRCFFGAMLLIGYLYSLKDYKNFTFYYLNFTVIPIIFLMYPAWRYIIPYSPILFLNFVYFIDYFARILKKNKI